MVETIDERIEGSNKITKEILSQISTHLETHQAVIYDSFLKNAGELSVSFKVSLKGNKQFTTVNTGVSFTASKITDGLSAEISLVQPDLYEEEV